jgi:hypothetical protein
MIAKAQDMPLRQQLEAAGRALLKHGMQPAPLAGAVLRLVDGDADLACTMLASIGDDFPVAKQAAGYLRDVMLSEGTDADR